MKIFRNALASALLSLAFIVGSVAPSLAAAGNWLVYGPAWEDIFDNTIDLDTDTWRIILATSSYTPNQSTHATYADVSAAEATGTAYTAGGQVVGLSLARSGLAVTLDATDESWASSTITAKYAIIVRDADANGALASTDIVLAYVDLDTGGGSLSTTNGTFSITMNASGILVFTAASS